MGEVSRPEGGLPDEAKVLFDQLDKALATGAYFCSPKPCSSFVTLSLMGLPAALLGLPCNKLGGSRKGVV